MLGTMVSGGREAMNALDGEAGDDTKKAAAKRASRAAGKRGAAKPAIPTIDEQPTLSKEEIAKIQGSYKLHPE